MNIIYTILRLILIIFSCTVILATETKQGITLRIAILFEDTAYDELQSPNNITIAAHQLVTNLNTALRLSGIPSNEIRFVLAHTNTKRLNYTSKGDADADYEWLVRRYSPHTAQNGKKMSITESHHSDFFSLIVKRDLTYKMNGKIIPIAGLGGSYIHRYGLSDHNRFSVTQLDYAFNNHTFEHEVGHNLGCGHSSIQYDSPGPQSEKLKPYSQAFYYPNCKPTTSLKPGHYSTIMAYTGANSTPHRLYFVRIPVFSSSVPNSYTGVTMGDKNHDNTRMLRETAQIYASKQEEKPVLVIATPPKNDNIQSALLLKPSRNSFKTNSYFCLVNANNRNATKEKGEAIHHFEGDTSVWYYLQAPAHSSIKITTNNSTFSSQIALYTINQGQLKKLASNAARRGTTNTTILTHNIQKGQTLYIALDGVAGDSGHTTLSIKLSSPESFKTSNSKIRQILQYFTENFVFCMFAFIIFNIFIFIIAQCFLDRLTDKIIHTFFNK